MDLDEAFRTYVEASLEAFDAAERNLCAAADEEERAHRRPEAMLRARSAVTETHHFADRYFIATRGLPPTHGQMLDLLQWLDDEHCGGRG
ncbi:MAG: hypothetical protein M3N39_13070, partial [Pseudomonadota bacterium]|nr:hypothetical protein [Pseudomonadota bacterium]